MNATENTENLIPEAVKNYISGFSPVLETDILESSLVIIKESYIDNFVICDTFLKTK